MSVEAISTAINQLCINNLTSDVINLEEKAHGYFTIKKLQQQSTWNEWKVVEKKQNDQFNLGGIMEIPLIQV